MPNSSDDLIPATRETYDGPLVVGEDLMQFTLGDDVTVTHVPQAPPSNTRIAF